MSDPLPLLEALELANDGILITDSDGIIRFVNRALERMTGYGRQELLGQNPLLFASSSYLASLYAFLGHAVQRRGGQGDLIERHKDGTVLEVSMSVSPLLDGHGEPWRFIGIVRDITEPKRVERQLLQAHKMQTVGSLASGVTHEFNNLLAGMSGYAALGLEEAAGQEPLREYLENIVGLTERSAILTRQLLAFARTPPRAQAALPLEELVRATADFVKRSLRAEVSLDLRPGDDGTPLRVEADMGQLQQTLVNLALNAQDAGGDMTFILRPDGVTAARQGFPDSVPPGDYVVLEVADRGRGMTPEVLRRAPEPFFTTKEVGHGTGLGLPVVLEIVHGHRGFVAIDSKPDAGCCVSMYLPRVRP